MGLNYVPSVQCAAVKTHLSLRSVPPQQMSAGEDEAVPKADLTNPTCHPISPLLTFSPPTILMEEFLSSTFSSNGDRFLFSLFLPQMHLKDEICPSLLACCFESNCLRYVANFLRGNNNLRAKLGGHHFLLRL